MKKIGIIGTGKIGSALAFELLFNKNIGEIQLYNRNKLKQDALITSLNIASHQVQRSIRVAELNFKNVEQLDLIIIAIKEDYDPRELVKNSEYPSWLPNNLRYAGLPLDYELLTEITNKLKHYNGIISVITNPVEMTTKYVSQKLKSRNVVGLGASVDSARISFMLYKQENIEIDVDNIVLFGEHGYKLTIVKSLSSTICEDGSCQKIIDTSTDIGFNIVKKIGYTLFDCIPSFIKDIEWLLKDPSLSKTYRSFSYFDGNYTLSQPLKRCKGFPKFDLYTGYSEVELNVISEMKELLNNQYDKIIRELEMQQLTMNKK